MTDQPDFSGRYWEDHYREPDHGSHEAPNAHLLAVAQRLPVGTALDAGCGEGADVILLAQLGWRVTGIDISATAIATAEEAAARAGLDPLPEFRCGDLTTGEPGVGRFDLVSAHYVHTPDDRAFVRALGSAVRPGGTLLVVGHEPPGEHDVDPHSPGSHSTAGQVAAYLDLAEWDVELADLRTGPGTRPDGSAVELRDSVFLAHKREASGAPDASA